MPRVKFKPHEEDLKAIKAFLKTVSWGSKCTLCTLLDGSAAYLLVNQLYILCPCSWEQYDEFKDVAKKRAASHGVRAGIIITDEADKQNCERIWWDSHRDSIIVQWLSVRNSLDSNRLLVQGLDGIDWGRSITNIINDGTKAKPVFRWEECDNA